MFYCIVTFTNVRPVVEGVVVVVGGAFVVGAVVVGAVVVGAVVLVGVVGAKIA